MWHSPILGERQGHPDSGCRGAARAANLGGGLGLSAEMSHPARTFLGAAHRNTPSQKRRVLFADHGGKSPS